MTTHSVISQTPLTQLKGVGNKLAERLAKLELHTVQDLLLHLPHRYQDRTRIYPIAHLQAGSHVTIEGEVQGADLKYGRRRMLIVRVCDNSGSLTLRFFNFSAAQTNSFSAGKQIRAFGEVRRGTQGPEMIHPEYRLSDDPDSAAVEEAMTPIYPATDGVRQLTLRSLTEQALAMLSRHPLPELLPANLYRGQIGLNDAIALLHRPPADTPLSALDAGTHPAQQRLVVEELAAHQLSVRKVRQQSDQHRAWALGPSQKLKPQLMAQLPFSPTGAQLRVVAEIEQDLCLTRPMMRLVQGDVGSGKTLVAAMAALAAIEAGYQVALMAPTELLAEQHANNLASWFAPLGVETAWLAGKQGAKARRESLAAVASGSAQLIVGTHAIFQEQVVFNALALVIVDEQHRFGVHQRLALKEKGAQDGVYPHQLIMTATPIPRTLAMTAYADLDTSIIDELPPGRTAVTTVAIPDSKRDTVVERVEHGCLQGKQAYWVCTLIEESETLQCQAAEDTAQALQAQLPQLRVGLVHGRMKASDKQQVMAQFKQGAIQLLVATTVIEVGVDVPNASLMVIENPERLGLAQLHQLRGRVGRGSTASHCVLLYHAPLSKTAAQRLGVLRDTSDGFVIAQRDLEIRGPGEVLGTRQTGLAQLKIADLARDQGLIPTAQRLAEHLLAQHPQLVDPLIQRWLPHRLNYGTV